VCQPVIKDTREISRKKDYSAPTDWTYSETKSSNIQLWEGRFSSRLDVIEIDDGSCDPLTTEQRLALMRQCCSERECVIMKPVETPFIVLDHLNQFKVIHGG
jgi:hypothetical protein